MTDIRTTGQLDDFNWGVYEDPISHGGAWANVDARWSGLTGGLAGTIECSNSDGFSWSYWTAGPFSGSEPIEVWGLPTGGQLGAAPEGWRLGIFQASSVGGSYQADGYQFGWFKSLGSSTIHRRYDNTSPTDIGTEDVNAAVWNSIMLLQRDEFGNFSYYLSDAGPDPSNWTLMAHATTDLTYTGPFYIALCAEGGSSMGWSAFGGGAAGPRRTQFFRRPSN